MRLVRFGERGRERPGLLKSDSEIIDLSPVVSDLDRRFWGEGGLPFVAAEQQAGRLDGLAVVPADAVRLGPPVADPRKLICIGLNFRDHAEESGAKIPELPLLFAKAVSTIVGPSDEIVLPSNYQTTDWEVELAFVMGRRTRRVDKAGALACVAGYTICHDVSERQAQIHEGGQWYRGKSFDTFSPLGPWVVTPDEVGDPGSLDMTLEVNGQRKQTGNTKTMIFDIAALVSFISRNITLEPGDIISTGTPPGVGAFRDPPEFLQPGDVVELSIAKLGTQRSQVVREPE